MHGLSFSIPLLSVYVGHYSWSLGFLQAAWKYTVPAIVCLFVMNSHHSLLIGINYFITPVFTFWFILIQVLKLHFSVSWIELFLVFPFDSNCYYYFLYLIYLVLQLLPFSCKYPEPLDMRSCLHVRLACSEEKHI